MNKAIVLSKRIIASAVNGIFSIMRFFSETVTATDRAEKSLGKGVSDSVSASDEFIRVVEFNRALADTATASETINKHSGKPLADAVSASDAFVRVAGYNRAVSDPVAASDSGRVLNQDYVNGFYFADDYVGIKREF